MGALGAAFLFLNVSDFDLRSSDFHCFYLSADAWRQGRAMYNVAVPCPVNLNAPWFAAAFSPLTFLHVPTAFALWTVGNALLVGFTIRRILLARPAIRWLPLVFACVTFLPAWMSWRHGQVTWLLFACVTRAWLAPTPVMASLWMLPAVMIKPPLALMALALPGPIAWMVGLMGAAATIVGIAALGWPVWADWLAMSGQVHSVSWPTNTSLWALVLRVEEWRVTTRFSELSLQGWLLVLSSAGTVWFWLRRVEGDRRWALAMLWGLALSPLGWLQYLTVGAGPILASAHLHRMVWLLPLVMVPRRTYLAWVDIGGSIAVVGGCLGVLMMAVLWWAVARPPAVSVSASVPVPPRSDPASRRTSDSDPT
jgi:hypothetical protein